MQCRLIQDINNQDERYYNRSTKRELKKKLLLLGVTSAKHAEFIIKNILGDQSAGVNQKEKEEVARVAVGRDRR